MTLLVDTSVWSLALRRDRPPDVAEIDELLRALSGAEIVVTTGLILQELLQGFVPSQTRDRIMERFARIKTVQPDLEDHINAAVLGNTCRSAGIQLGTIDAVIAQLCIRHRFTLLSTDRDFAHAAPHIGLRLWQA